MRRVLKRVEDRAESSPSRGANHSIQDPRTYAIIGAALEVHRELGCGLNEVFYQDALELEFKFRGIPYSREPAYHMFYKQQKLRSFLRPDFICYDSVIVELKALTEITGREISQILGYLKGTGFQIGLLINFGSSSMTHDRFIQSSKWIPEAVKPPILDQPSDPFIKSASRPSE